MINTEVLDKILIKDNHILNRKQRIVSVTLILFITFIIMTTLGITEGFMKMEMYIEQSGIGGMIETLFVNIIYVFPVSVTISILTNLLKNIDTTIKSTLIFLPLYVILFWLPSVYAAKYIVEWL